MDSMTPIDGRFMPPTAQDFSTRSVRLSPLLDTPVQWAQEALSRLYGFANAHELRQALRRPGHNTGPFDEVLEDSGAQRRRTLASLLFDHGHDDIRAFKRSLVAELGLFASPDGHERSFAQVEDALAYYMPDPAGSPCYARVGFSAQGEALLHRTQLGRQVHDAMIKALDPSDGVEVYRAVQQLAKQHPGAPWAQADLLDEELAGLLAAPRAIQAAALPKLSRQATAIVTQFRRLYGEYEPLAIAVSLISPSPFGSDSDGYARALALAGKLAMAVGDYGAAVRRFRRLLRMDNPPRRFPEPVVRDPRGVRRFLDVALLNHGRPARRGRLKQGRRVDEGACWRLLLDFAANALANDIMALRVDLIDVVLIHGRLPLKADLAAALYNDPEEQVHVPFAALGHLHIDQFFLATAPLWRARPDLTAILIAVLRDQAVARADGALLAANGDIGERSDRGAYDAIARLDEAIDGAWKRAKK